MQIEIKRLQRQLGLTTILVTHDQDEAMSVADRIAVMNKGKVEQFDAPVAIYDRPQTLFVNGFIGTDQPAAAARSPLSTAAPRPWRWTPARRFACPRHRASRPAALVVLSVRPEQLALSPVAGRRAGRSSRASACRWARSSCTRSRTADGTALKIAEPRLAAPHGERPAPSICGLAPDARPSLFPRSTHAATE